MTANMETSPARSTRTPAEGLKASRRDVMKGLALAAVAGGLGTAALAESAAGPIDSGYPDIAPAAGDTIRASDTNPEAETAYGRIRGYIRNGIYAFKDIPYGADTSGANRFLPPRKPASWTGTRPCLYHGFVSPQAPREGWKNNEESWLFSWDDGTQSEDCLNLNVWTAGLDGARRPVMVWLHGGGFSAGSSTELPSYDGENLARRGVVLVSVNHRLNIFGHLNLAGFGDQYAVSGNAGMLDIVAALEWVRDHIERFGGDPGRVTIFGQSGGGGKVSTLMAMPSARGLFHRAIVESGSLLTGQTMESSHTLTEKVLRQLNLSSSQIDKLQQLPFAEIEQAAIAATPFHMPASGVIDFRHISRLLGWAPVVGNAALPDQPFDPTAPAMSASVPMIVGNTINEFINGINKPDAFKMTRAELETHVSRLSKDKAAEVIAVFRKAYPNANNFQLWSTIAASMVRGATLEQVRRKAAQKAAPAYCYRFDWQTPILDGRPMAFHCSELSFVFDNTARCENMTGNGAAARALAGRMSEAWIHFAATGNPNHPGLPRWKPFDAATNGTMVFDDQCAFREHLDDECQKIINEI
ncbi:MAG TPA: carboxylesterase family protein [Terracidiphilus sp.]|nr:carboxylesterase family protein [Terracidiphilus sp.]